MQDAVGSPPPCTVDLATGSNCSESPCQARKDPSKAPCREKEDPAYGKKGQRSLDQKDGKKSLMPSSKRVMTPQTLHYMATSTKTLTSTVKGVVLRMGKFDLGQFAIRTLLIPSRTHVIPLRIILFAAPSPILSSHVVTVNVILYSAIDRHCRLD